jgi:LPS-assembly lipoprotein
MARTVRAMLGGLLAAVLLAGCGFHLRSSQNFAFETVAVTPENSGAVATEMTRYFGKAIRPVAPKAGEEPPQAIVDILEETRQKTVVSTNASGQVREFQLRISVRFRMRTPQGAELISPTVVTQQRDISFNESAVLAKEAEETLLWRDMQSDIVQQLMRRVASVKSLTATAP